MLTKTNYEATSKEQALGALVVLLTVQQVASMCSLSPRTIWRLHDIEHWVAMDCPDRATFDARQAVGS